LDGHAHLKKHGWEGKGKALRSGAISRPIAVPQKRNLAGVGKDRDEAFPFWDHVFTAAASAIQIKVFGDDDEGTSSVRGSSTPAPLLQRTSTGILSNKRPVTGTPAHSSLPSRSSSPAPATRLTVVAAAKREAARRNLYSRFFRGPVIGPDTTEQAMVQTEQLSLEDKLATESEAVVEALTHTKKKGKEKADDNREGDVGAADGKEKRSKEKEERRRMKEARRAAKIAEREGLASTGCAPAGVHNEDEEARKERKRKRKEAKEMEKTAKEARKREEISDSKPEKKRKKK
ncbi:hypothetical protein K488DRAFT_35757, partial [Vararia minispora EC-137]